MYIGPWQEYQLASKFNRQHDRPQISYGGGIAIGNEQGQVGSGMSMRYRNGQNDYSAGQGLRRGGGTEGIIVGKDMVDSLKQQVDYLARLLEEQGGGGGGAVGAANTSSSSSSNNNNNVGLSNRGGINLAIQRADHHHQQLASSGKHKPQQRGMTRNRRGGKNNSAVGYSRILSSLSQQAAQIDVNAFNYNSNMKPPMSARSYNSDFSLNSRYSYSHSEPGWDGGGSIQNGGISTLGFKSSNSKNTDKDKIRRPRNDMATSMREMSHSAPTDGAGAAVGNGFAMGGTNQNSEVSKTMYGGGYNKNLAARMLKVNRSAREGGFTKLGDTGKNDNIKNLFHTKALVGRSEKEGGVVSGGGAKGKRRGSVEMVKHMHKLYMSGAVDAGVGESGGGEQQQHQLQQQQRQAGASPPGGGGVAAARSINREKEHEGAEVETEPHVVQDMDLTKQEFSQVSKYFGIDLDELEEGLGLGDEGEGGGAGVEGTTTQSPPLNPSSNSNILSPIRTSPSPNKIGGTAGSVAESSNIDSVPMTPMTPNTQHASVDELISWVGGLNETEFMQE